LIQQWGREVMEAGQQFQHEGALGGGRRDSHNDALGNVQCQAAAAAASRTPPHDCQVLTFAGNCLKSGRIELSGRVLGWACQHGT